MEHSREQYHHGSVIRAKEEVLCLNVENRRQVTEMHDGDVKGLGYNV